MTRYPFPIAWRRSGAPRHYAGTLDVEAGELLLDGKEPSTGVRTTLRIPSHAVQALRVARRDDEAIAGVKGYVLELADDVPLFVRALGVESLHDAELGDALAEALDLPPPQLVS
jgi:hypothetical protein